MTIESFRSSLGDAPSSSPAILVLRLAPAPGLLQEPSFIAVERVERVVRGSDGRVVESKLTLNYEVLGPCRGWPGSGHFGAWYAMDGLDGNETVSLTGGGMFLDPPELRGRGLGTYLLDTVVSWAARWPAASVKSIELVHGQANAGNLERRNRSYEQFNIFASNLSTLTVERADHCLCGYLSL